MATPTPESEEDKKARIKSEIDDLLGTPAPAIPSPTPGPAVTPTTPPTTPQQRVPDPTSIGTGGIGRPVPGAPPQGGWGTRLGPGGQWIAKKLDQAGLFFDPIAEVAGPHLIKTPIFGGGIPGLLLQSQDMVQRDPESERLALEFLTGRGDLSGPELAGELRSRHRQRPFLDQLMLGAVADPLAAVPGPGWVAKALRSGAARLPHRLGRAAPSTALAVREPVEAAAAEGLRSVPTAEDLQMASFGTTPPPSRVLIPPAPTPAIPLPGRSDQALFPYFSDVLEPVVAPPRATPADMAQVLGRVLPETPPPGAIPLGPSAAARAADDLGGPLSKETLEADMARLEPGEAWEAMSVKAGREPFDVYHGSDATFDISDIETTLPSYPGDIGEGIYFAPHPETAGIYGKNIYRTQLNVENPLIIDASKPGITYREVPELRGQSVLVDESMDPFDVSIGGVWHEVRNADDLSEIGTLARYAGHDAVFARYLYITRAQDEILVLDPKVIQRPGVPAADTNIQRLEQELGDAQIRLDTWQEAERVVRPPPEEGFGVGWTAAELRRFAAHEGVDATVPDWWDGIDPLLKKRGMWQQANEPTLTSLKDDVFVLRRDLKGAKAARAADIPVAPTGARAAPTARAPGNWVYHKTNEVSLQDIVDQGFGQGDFIEGMSAFNKLDLPGNVILRVKRANLPPGQIGEYSGAKWHLPNYEAARAPLSPDLIEIKVNKLGNPATVREAGATWKPLREYVADKAPVARAGDVGPAPADLLYPGRPGTRELPTTQYRGGAYGIPRLYRDAPVPPPLADVPTTRIPTTEELQRASFGTGMRRVRAELPPDRYLGRPGLTPQQPSARPPGPLTQRVSDRPISPEEPLPSPQRVPAPDIPLYDQAYALQEATRKFGTPAPRATRAQAAQAVSEASDTAATIARGGGEIPPGTPGVADAGSLPPSASNVMDQISFKEPRQRLLDRFRSGLAGLKRAIGDDLTPIDRFVTVSKELGSEVSLEENPYIWARLLRGISGKSNTFLEKGTFGKRYWKMQGGRAVPDFKGPGLYQILEPVRDAGSHQAFSTYLTARRAVELADKGIVTGITKQDALKSIAELDRANPGFRGTSQQVYKYQDDLIEYARESGLLSNEMVARLRNYKNYVPFHRVMDSMETQGFTGKKMANIVSPIKRMKGSERTIINPLESIIKNTHALIEAADRNQVGVMMARMASESPELQSLFKAKKTPVSKVAKVNAKELGIDISGLSEADANMLVDIFRPATYAKGADEVTVMINGQKRFFDVDPDLYKSLTNIDQIDLGLFGKFFGAPARWLRAGAVLSPDFMVKNPIRDQLTAFVYSKFGFLPGIDWMKGMGQMLNKSDDYHLYRMSGAEHSNLVSVDRAMTGRTVKEIAEEKGFTDYIKSPTELLRVLSETGEKGTRLGEFSRALSAGETPIAAGFSAREVSQDFAKMGVVTRAVNQIIPFFGANVGGWTRAKTAFTQRPIQSSAKAFLGITLPSILLYSINRNDERYKEIPQWQKDLFWIIPTPNAMLRFPKPFLVGQVFGSVPERFLEFLDERDPEMLAETLKSVVGEGVPGWAPQAVLPFVENATNHSFFLDRPIVPRDREDAPSEMQYSGRTTEAAKALGKWVNLSPAQIDNVFSAYTGGLGRYATDILDPALRAIGIADRIADPDPTWADLPIIRSFVVRDPYGSSGVSVDKFYDVLKDFEGQEKMYKELIALGRQDAVVKYKDSHPSAGLGFDYKYGGVHYSATARALRRVAGAMSDIRKYQRGVYNSRTMSGAEKRRNIDASNKQLTLLAQKALADLEKILP